MEVLARKPHTAKAVSAFSHIGTQHQIRRIAAIHAIHGIGQPVTGGASEAMGQLGRGHAFGAIGTPVTPLTPLTKDTVGTLFTACGSMSLHIGGASREFPL